MIESEVGDEVSDGSEVGDDVMMAGDWKRPESFAEVRRMVMRLDGIEDARERRLMERRMRTRLGVAGEEIVTLTFGDRCENHRGMQILGEEHAGGGFSMRDLRAMAVRIGDGGGVCELIDLGADMGPEFEELAGVLVLRGGVDWLCGVEGGAGGLMDEMLGDVDWDRKALMYGRVVNKWARWNVCFADESQEPDYAAGRGRVIAWRDVRRAAALREAIGELIGDEREILGEGNRYPDRRECGIGWHGDSERTWVCGVRLGASMPLSFRWYQGALAVGSVIDIQLSGGDIYFLSSKAVGTDWKRTGRGKLTLRHAAGIKYVAG